MDNGTVVSISTNVFIRGQDVGHLLMSLSSPLKRAVFPDMR